MPRQFHIVVQQSSPRGQRRANDTELQNMFRNNTPSLDLRDVYFPNLSAVKNVVRHWGCDSRSSQILAVNIEMVSPTEWNILGYHQCTMPFTRVRYTTPIPFNPNCAFFEMSSMAEISNVVTGWDENTITDALRADVEYFRAEAETNAELGIVNTVLNVDPVFNQPQHGGGAPVLNQPQHGGLAPVLNQPQRGGAAPELNNAQSTHTASVHKSVTHSLINLNNEYGNKLDINKQIISLQEFEKKINRNEFPTIPQYQLASAIKCLARMSKLYEEKEAGSNFTIKKILALIWVAMHDVKNTKDAEEAFIKALYEIQRGYNLNAKGEDNMETEDRPICTGGTINKLVASQNGVHKSVNIDFVTAKSAGFKVMGITGDCIFEYATQSENPEKTLRDILASIEKCGGIPDEFWNKIKDQVVAKMNDEFGGFLQNDIIDKTASQGEFTNFDKGQQQRMLERLFFVLQNTRAHTQPIGQSISENKTINLSPRIECLFKAGLNGKDQLNILLDIEKHGDHKEKNQVKLFWDSTENRKVSKEQFEDYKIILNTFLKKIFDIVKIKIEDEPESFKLFRDHLLNDKISLSEKLFELKKIASNPANLSILNNTLHNKNLCSIIKNIDLTANNENLKHNMNQLKSLKRQYYKHNLIQNDFISQQYRLKK